MVVTGVCVWIPGVGYELLAPVCPTYSRGVQARKAALLLEEGKSEDAVVGGPGLLTVQTFLRTHQVCPNVKPHQAGVLY